MLILVLSFLACGPKAPPEAAVPAPAPEVPVVEVQPEPEPEPVVEAPRFNADMNVTVTYSSGETISGHVVRIERSTDWFGEESWSMDEGDLKISAESSTAYEKLTWNDVRSIVVTPGSVPDDVDCVYDSNWTPWMYDCTLKTSAALTDTAGGSWTVDNRHKWRLTFDDDRSIEFWLKKHPAREQDSQTVTLDTEDPQNFDLYTKLQQRLREERASTMVVRISVE